MNTKIEMHLSFTLIILTFVGVILSNTFSAANVNEAKLWNLQKLEKLAETGNVEAQLRLIDFYRSDISGRDYFKERLEFWLEKSELKKQTDEYSVAATKLQQERTEAFEQQQEKEDAMKARLVAVKEKYEKLEPDANKNGAMIMRDGMSAAFDMEKVYSWEVPYNWRYRITINIDTPEGVKSGTTVRELYFPPADGNWQTLDPADLNIIPERMEAAE